MMRFVRTKQPKTATRFWAAGSTRGVSLVEVIIVSALTTLMFSGLFSGLQLMVDIITNSKAESGARSLALERLEYIRSLPYDDVGTVGGIGPQGLIPQTSTFSLNDIIYEERVFIAYIDRVQDGFGSVDDTIPGIPADNNGIEEDSKTIKIQYTWDMRGRTRTTTFVSDVVPRGEESTAGGGTLRVNVRDADIAPLAGATVVINNFNVGSFATTTSDVNGMANFPGAPAGGGYEITVSRADYSTDGTYSIEPGINTNPDPGHIAVVAGYTSSATYYIDELSTLTLRAISTPVRGLFSDTFTNDLNVATGTEYQVTANEVTLSGGSGSYAATGTVFATTTEPTTLDSWESFDFNGTSTANSELRVRLYSTSGSGTSTTYTLIPDTELANNSIGFIAGPIDITSIDVSTYDRIALGATLTSSDNTETPRLYDWSLTHIESEIPISGLTFDVVGAKTIGSNGSDPVYKYETSVVTDGAGEYLLSDLEWDAYDISLDGSVQGFDVVEAYAPLPYALEPGVNETLTLVLEPHNANSLRTTVVDDTGQPIGGADVTLSRSGYTETLETSIYGQVFFSSVASNTDYTLDVVASGYPSEQQTNLAITGTTQLQVVLGSSTGDPDPDPDPTPSTYLAGYDSRVPITISGSSLFGTVANFPVYLDLSDLPSGFFSSVQSTGGDIRVTLADEQTEVPREVVAIDTGAQTGQVHFRAPSLDTSTTTTFYVYFGSSTAPAYADSDALGRNNVWTNGYRAVYHFEEAQAGTGNAGVYIDATGSGFNGDDFISATGKTGIMGSGQEFSDSSNDRIDLPHTTIDGLRDITVSTWFRSNDTNNLHTIMSAANNSRTDNEHTIWIRADQNEVELFSHSTNGREEFSVGNVFDDVWRHFTVVKDDSTDLARFYLNGVENGDSPDLDNVWTIDVDPGGLMIGQEQDFVGGGFDNGQELNGDIDEMRISDVVRSASWIRNEYQNQNNPSAFYGVGSIETE